MVSLGGYDQILLSRKPRVLVADGVDGGTTTDFEQGIHNVEPEMLRLSTDPDVHRRNGSGWCCGRA
ncbi:hypothetical protein Tsubulata_043676, partial [Turnera subulata]